MHQGSSGSGGCDPVYISCKSGVGVDELLAELERLVQHRLGLSSSDGDGDGGGILLTRARHREHMVRCADALSSFLAATGGADGLAPELPLDMAAEELRVAVLELGRVTGRVDVEELLDVIFGDFCIGK